MGGKQAPFYKLHGKEYNFQLFHQLFCNVFTIKLKRPNIIQPKGIKCLFIGYADNYIIPTAKLLNLETNRVISRSLADCFQWSDNIDCSYKERKHRFRSTTSVLH